MLHRPPFFRVIQRVARKELTLFFSSPVAWLFLASFAAVSLFVFFWGESFFSRNIADVRPLFEWMPVLLIFLASALTMRLWSEERRTGTLEHVLTQAVPVWQFVFGKFFACLFLLCIALLITLPLPITVTFMGDLDWGPVWAGYLATVLLGAAYISIGLCVSARSDNQIVSLIVSVLVCGLLYLSGAPVITDLFGNQVGEWLRSIGTGARFDAITRGMLDLRDLYYYLSIVAVFLALNICMLERGRWALIGRRDHHQNWNRLTVLWCLNFLVANLWLSQIHFFRTDVTQGKQYSISPVTHRYLAELEEPLLMRGYFSSKTHPLLAPLVPQLRDLLREYEIAGRGNVEVEFIDPLTEPELEKEANQKYGIESTAFQVQDRYQSSIVSSYFDVLVQYGDEVEVLSFGDLIEVKLQGGQDLDVRLRNPEHDVTRAIKKVLSSYRAGGDLFDSVSGSLFFEGFVSAEDRLPLKLRTFKEEVDKLVRDLQEKSGGRFRAELRDPDADDGQLATFIKERYGFRPMSSGLFSAETFYFYFILSQGDRMVQIPVEDLSREGFERNLKAAVQRFTSGFVKTVGLVTPDADPALAQQGQAGSDHVSLVQFLSQGLNVEPLDISTGIVPGNIDLLVVAGPKDMQEKEVFAVDQFLMQGGTVVVATSPFTANLGNRSLDLLQQQSGLGEWLAHHGLYVAEQLVLDPQNAAFPVPVSRDVGGFKIQEVRMFDYPYFIDVRSGGMPEDSAITSNLHQVLMPWASPIQVTEVEERTVKTLLRSSPGAWLSPSTDILPRVSSDGRSSGFVPEGETGEQLLGVMSQGRFTSYFADRGSPLLSASAEQAEANIVDPENNIEPVQSDAEDEKYFFGVIGHSPESARIILFGSSDLLRDQVMQLLGMARRSEYTGNLELLANAVDWSLEDEGLANIRSRGHFNRTLAPMQQNEKLFWEILNYVLEMVAISLVAIVRKWWYLRWQGRCTRIVLNEGGYRS